MEVEGCTFKPKLATETKSPSKSPVKSAKTSSIFERNLKWKQEISKSKHYYILTCSRSAGLVRGKEGLRGAGPEFQARSAYFQQRKTESQAHY
jgi:hypothetical protein